MGKPLLVRTDKALEFICPRKATHPEFTLPGLAWPEPGPLNPLLFFMAWPVLGKAGAL